MKAETFLKLTLCHSSLSFTYNRYENGHQLVRLICQRLHLVSSAQSCSFQQLQPIRRLLKFLHLTFYRGPKNYCVRGTRPDKTCSSSFLAELRRFENSRNVEMSVPSNTSTFSEFRKREKQTLLVPSPETQASVYWVPPES
jgi:hypothetical protein